MAHLHAPLRISFFKRAFMEFDPEPVIKNSLKMAAFSFGALMVLQHPAFAVAKKLLWHLIFPSLH